VNEKEAARRARYRAKAKADAFAAYGGKCKQCSAVESLEFHHTLGGGNEHRRDLLHGRRSGGWQFCVALRQLGYPQDIGIELLCTACHDAEHPARGNPYAQRKEK